MTRLTPKQLIDTLRLIDRRAKGLEPGDDALSRLRLADLAVAPWRWLRTTVAKLAVVFLMAAIVAAIFAGGIAVMKALGMAR